MYLLKLPLFKLFSYKIYQNPGNSKLSTKSLKLSLNNNDLNK